MKLVRSIACCVVLVFALVTVAAAYDLPAVNLGFTSFLDGPPPAGPGVYVQQYVQFYTSDSFKDARGATIPFPDPDLEAIISLSQLIYQSDTEVLAGGKWGLDIILPYVDFDLSYAAAGPFPQADSGYGDLLVGPYLQWAVMGENGPVLFHRVELQMLLPVGNYSDDYEINAGANVFSFNPYWAGTYFVSPDLTASWRLHYLWNDENDNPAESSGALNMQAGQAVHANFAAAYALCKAFRFGVNGYYLKQITETEANGVDVADSEEQVLGLGVGGLLSFGPETHVFVNGYWESETENRPEGERINVRFVQHF